MLVMAALLFTIQILTIFAFASAADLGHYQDLYSLRTATFDAGKCFMFVHGSQPALSSK